MKGLPFQPSVLQSLFYFPREYGARSAQAKHARVCVTDSGGMTAQLAVMSAQPAERPFVAIALSQPYGVACGGTVRVGRVLVRSDQPRLLGCRAVGPLCDTAAAAARWNGRRGWGCGGGAVLRQRRAAEQARWEANHVPGAGPPGGGREGVQRTLSSRTHH